MKDVNVKNQLNGNTHQNDGVQILDDVHSLFGRFISYPTPEAHTAHTLWIAHTHMMDIWDSTPRLAALSPEKACGKSRVLEVSELLVPNPVQSVNVTPAYLFRKVADEAGRPTILYDEIDTVFGPKARDNEEVRGLLNAGYRKHSTAGRCAVRGNQIITEEIPAYCAVALAGIGNLPDTIMSRSIILRMRRRAPHEKVEPYRERTIKKQADALRERLAIWGLEVTNSFDGQWPEMPDGIEDRDADNWEALLAVAEAAGGHWPERTRVACLALVADSQKNQTSLGVRLLEDLKAIFESELRLPSQEILERLKAMEEAPWASLRGSGLDARGLANLLQPYDIRSRDIRCDGKILKGYRREDLRDAWQRYLPAPPFPEVGDKGNEGNKTGGNGADVADVADVAGMGGRPAGLAHDPASS